MYAFQDMWKSNIQNFKIANGSILTALLDDGEITVYERPAAVGCAGCWWNENADDVDLEAQRVEVSWTVLVSIESFLLKRDSYVEC